MLDSNNPTAMPSWWSKTARPLDRDSDTSAA